MIIFFQKLVKEAQETHDKTYDRHFLDVYLSEMEKELNEEKRSTFSGTREQIMVNDFVLVELYSSCYFFFRIHTQTVLCILSLS